MLEDRVLVWKMTHGSGAALCRIYDKYKRDMLSLANALLHDIDIAEDVVHDVFVSFVQSANDFKLTGSLKGYLLTCVANLSRDRVRAKKRTPQSFSDSDIQTPDHETPCQTIISAEQLLRVKDAIATLPYDQREVVILHLQAGKTFRQIATLQKATVSTTQSRYRYGLEKLKSLLDGEVEK